VLLALSTSGNSSNVIAALAQARRDGLGTIAMVGYDGGRVASEALADHVVITRSEHIPRIQEAQASAYHVLVELVELVGPAPGGTER
jgi:D-sedoheptulose 7-phosphate isomerase